MTVKDIDNDIKSLYAKLATREGKYTRNFNRYQNNATRRESIWTLDMQPQAYAVPAVGSDGTQTQFNYIKSLVDTIVAKISQANVRPFINPVGGDWKTRQAAKTAQKFFDIYFNDQHVYEKSVKALRDACIFDLGVLWIDEEEARVNHINPWCYFLDPAEYQAHYITRTFIFRKQYPAVACLDQSDNQKFKEEVDRHPHMTGDYVIYYDLYNGERWDFFNKFQLRAPKKLNFGGYHGLSQRPFAEIFYNQPIKGFFSTSLADDVYTQQRQMDELNKRIDAATRNAIVGAGFIPSGSRVKASVMENGAWKMYDYTPGPDGGVPTFVTPPPISEGFMSIHERTKQEIYSIHGINQLDAQSKKPAGLNSGVALETYEDIASDRHQVILHSYISFMVEVARRIVDCFPAKESVLPDAVGRAGVRWGDIKGQKAIFNIEFTAGSSLSKDPATKIDQIQKLASLKLIDENMMSSLMELPDLENAYTVASSSYDYCQRIIDQTVTDRKVPDYLPVVNFSMLQNETIKTLNILAAAGEDKPIIDALVKLLKKVIDQQNELAPPDMGPPMPPPMGPPPMGPEVGIAPPPPMMAG